MILSELMVLSEPSPLPSQALHYRIEANVLQIREIILDHSTINYYQLNLPMEHLEMVDLEDWIFQVHVASTLRYSIL
jgi:hypothetical protein